MKKRTIIIESIILVAMIVTLAYFTIVYINGESETSVKAEEEIDANLIKYAVKAKSFMKGFDDTDSMKRVVNFINNLDEKSFDEIFAAVAKKLNEDKDFLKNAFFFFQAYLSI